MPFPVRRSIASGPAVNQLVVQQKLPSRIHDLRVCSLPQQHPRLHSAPNSWGFSTIFRHFPYLSGRLNASNHDFACLFWHNACMILQVGVESVVGAVASLRIACSLPPSGRKWFAAVTAKIILSRRQRSTWAFRPHQRDSLRESFSSVCVRWLDTKTHKGV